MLAEDVNFKVGEIHDTGSDIVYNLYHYRYRLGIDIFAIRVADSNRLEFEGQLCNAKYYKNIRNLLGEKLMMTDKCYATKHNPNGEVTLHTELLFQDLSGIILRLA